MATTKHSATAESKTRDTPAGADARVRADWVVVALGILITAGIMTGVALLVTTVFLR